YFFRGIAPMSGGGGQFLNLLIYSFYIIQGTEAEKEGKNIMTWKEFEKNVREIASYRWGCTATQRTIAGVRCDCILEVDTDSWVAVEITQEHNLVKIREDVAKLISLRNHLIADNIYCKCYIVMQETPTDAMRDTGKAQKVTVMSVKEFRDDFFNYSNYVFIRKQKPFGSLINIETGEPENNIYVNVSYIQKDSGNQFTVADIIDNLKRGKHIVLKGDFGLGKSRCVKQVFDKLTANPAENFHTIAINLRDHWGAKRTSEILSRHFCDLGIVEHNFMKIYEAPRNIYLLDGFDEIGTQAWSSDARKMQHIRELSMAGLKDLIQHVQGGILITGREYYFNSDSEMMSSLGLSPEQTVILECQQEFTDSELLDFIRNNIPEGIGSETLGELPLWFPKRPLVIQLLLKCGDIFSIKKYLIIFTVFGIIF
ncbi:hypothetical protein, partial [uncultured Dysosmobacter sp.]|uniref:hypothetical protein n=1 Tax=uncultured Dysosmobacter sp. TaxID=2591384 RepID=UPI0026151535